MRRTGAFLGAACYLLPYCICRTLSALLCEAHVTGFGLFVSLPFSTSFSSPAPASRCPPVCPDAAGGCGRGAGTWDGPSARRGVRDQHRAAAAAPTCLGSAPPPLGTRGSFSLLEMLFCPRCSLLAKPKPEKQVTNEVGCFVSHCLIR